MQWDPDIHEHDEEYSLGYDAHSTGLQAGWMDTSPYAESRNE